LIVLRRRDQRSAAASAVSATAAIAGTAATAVDGEATTDSRTEDAATLRPYRADYHVPGYPLVPLVFAASAFAIVINQVISSPVESLTGLSLVLIGLPVYYLWARDPREQPSIPDPE
jgi:hypothetical protein